MSKSLALQSQPASKIAARQLELLKRARLGGYLGDSARSTLIKEYYPWVVQRCRQTLKNEADAQDAAQEVALRMYRSLARFEGRSSLRTWVERIVHNECVNLIRRRQKFAMTSQMTGLITIYEQDQRFGEAPDAVAEAAVRRTLNLLTPENQEVLTLRFFRELPIAEIGELLGISLSATKMRLYRALDAFKATLLEQSIDVG